MTVKEYVAALQGTEAAEALSALCVLAKSKEGRGEIEAALGNHLVLRSCTLSPEPKVRKNAYRLIGALGNKTDAGCLKRALEKEETFFAIPSLLLSLGSLGEEEALRNYVPPVSTGEAMDKHVAEIALARQKALQTFEKEERPPIAQLKAPREVLCYAPEGFAFCLFSELRGLGFAVEETEEAGSPVRVVTDRMDIVYQADCLVEALMPIAKEVPLEAEAIAKAVGEMPAEPYRIELRGYVKDRRKLIHLLSERLAGKNNPAAYDWELRVDCHMDTADLYWKLCNGVDGRYPWRKRTIPASMHPALAACVSRYAMGLGKVGKPRVLDPFCGSGSLLFEREKWSPCKVLIGVDKSGNAVEAARENARAVGSKASFVTKDILRFESREGFDLILTNMPFGNRVGSHEDNKTLYRRFVSRLPQLLTPKGTAVLYTMEYKLLESCLKNVKGLQVREIRRTEAGGLLPWVFVVDRAAEAEPRPQ